MAQKYEVFHEIGWNERTNSAEYEKLTTMKNEKAAIAFINNLDNIGKYGNMFIEAKLGGKMYMYNERTDCWEPK